jgi:hypothetical protein
MKTRKIKLVSILGSVLLLAAGCNTLPTVDDDNSNKSITSQTYQQQSNNTNTTSTPEQSNKTEAKFTGTIKATKNEMPFDGLFSIQVDDKWIAINGSQIANTPNGIVSGLDFSSKDNIGTKVEVFAQQVSSSNTIYFSILGDAKYYVRAIR